METIDQFVGLEQDWANYITNVEMRETPFLDWLSVGTKPVNPRFNYQAERFRTPRANSHVDGKPFNEPYSAGDSRAQLDALIQWFDSGVSVSKLSQDVTSNAAIADELAHEIPKMMKEVAQDIEVNFLDDHDHRVDNKVVGYRTRAVGSWIASSQQALYPVDTNFLPGAAQIVSTSWSAIAEDEIRTLVQGIWQVAKSSEPLTAFAGSNAMKGLSDWQYRLPGSTAAAIVVNPAVKREFKDKTISRAVRMWEGDLMDVEFVPTPWLANLTGSATVQRGRVYYLHRSKWEVRWNQKPRVYKPEFKGGSYEAFMDTLLMLVCKNPAAEGKQNPST